MVLAWTPGPGDGFAQQKREAAKPAPTPAVQPPVAAPAPARRYVYADDQGQLQFADRLSDVPAKYRDQAQPMGE